jgi:hypothetical protein
MDELVNKYSDTPAVEEAEAPAYVSPLMALLTGEARGEPQAIEIPPPSPELAKRIADMERRQEVEVEKARERAYEDAHGLLAARGIGRPIHDSELSASDLAELNRLRKEWNDWHEVHADTWRPDGGPLDVGGLP